ncbi:MULTISPECIES: GNAT family N-acetyltransferase [Bosea]|uniref:GNAT family N-acetyltransferase n=1 Tax=Bosea TaxID=85413 RepID=UPI00214F656A|nr:MULTISPECIES: GNAT family N-acetyltransferase [Bosea]MCR4520796.1 GNAT family N-acetyltransferase [Bosea sp. 47.2.35]MDR6828262.1 putative N-acyltransferase [Bosea robiniae]MDR6894921.1 putative N-acyltransferase [Bosea sp. BE109]MDR7138513.1 putative N-acyltransferase [Bosea sp. BE168]MDR7175212.1 putative N-acyltransferase [Bosea sp. BE271]
MSEAGNGDLTVRVATSLKAVPAGAWNACANPHALADAISAPAAPPADPALDRDNPFVSHEFLMALEDSRCIGGRTGWSPAYLLVENDAGQLLAAAPSFLKSHSQGEYVFDHSWADAYERAGGRYYPKLQVAAPFTPATGPRLLVADSPRADEARAALIGGLEALRGQTQSSSVHVTFAQEPDIAALKQAGYIERNDLQFHWQNEGFGSYDDFLATLASRKRKTLKRERREALANDITIEVLSGNGLTEAVWDDFFSFYEDTGSRKWGRPYLNRAFFSAVGAAMGERIVLVMAKRAGRHIAGAINFRGANTLYGRNWGCIEDHPFLHFEVCYHQAIDYAIAHGLARVEAGAQGEHKLARGYRPVITRSLHHIADPGLRRPVAAYLAQEREQIAAAREALAVESPFRKTDTADD